MNSSSDRDPHGIEDNGRSEIHERARKRRERRAGLDELVAIIVEDARREVPAAIRRGLILGWKKGNDQDLPPTTSQSDA